ncbi:MAG: Transcriptional repressor NrdR [Microgenomates group bacterium GW2011_GWF2_45_18]|nr:MAG: Transcriptional repressor NrdR [Microgenomates group bacterium GW2011_GWF1_44_10]KKU01606.1 MAG: Transcriptional repressor NrdR [Microgenomates group bacterium GW2011_GWF2_45_18]OGJ41558.1 MAG: transcriptional regulator NrdR [Candidatus Pacebacteria bacterium RIFOXYB1_FULL_44_10]HAU99513.1 transcriptional regulator NrdR [Candidatus Paceibacterota bacterium]HAX01323.1 transcriptional regulator NrdR [Candidatus Paceibacterota bacterium]
MKCPYCGVPESSVLESRDSFDQTSIRRRRECAKCGKRFTTFERVEGVDLIVIKKDGEREPFDRDKIRKGLMKATWKRPLTIDEIELCIDEIERKLRLKTTKEVKSWEIGNLVMNRLKKLDPVSYMLFATVYRDIHSIDEFDRELQKVKSAITEDEEK